MCSTHCWCRCAPHVTHTVNDAVSHVSLTFSDTVPHMSHTVSDAVPHVSHTVRDAVSYTLLVTLCPSCHTHALPCTFNECFSFLFSICYAFHLFHYVPCTLLLSMHCAVIYISLCSILYSVCCLRCVRCLFTLDTAVKLRPLQCLLAPPLMPT